MTILAFAVGEIRHLIFSTEKQAILEKLNFNTEEILTMWHV